MSKFIFIIDTNVHINMVCTWLVVIVLVDMVISSIFNQSGHFKVD